jgi:hypothetical protein
MIGRLLQSLVQEVPEELSVCEFDCPHTRCIAISRAECELLNEAALFRGPLMPEYSPLQKLKAIPE